MKKITILLIIVAMLTACGREQTPGAAVEISPSATPALGTDTPEPTAEPTNTPNPTVTPPLPPLGEEGNPIVWGIVSEGTDMAVFAPAIDQTVYILNERTGLAFEIQVLESYSQVVEMLCSGEIQLGNLDAFSYILAQDLGCTSRILTAERFGNSAYQGQILVRRDSNINSMAELAGFTYCRSAPNSRSSWIVPRLMMLAVDIDPDTDLKEIIDTVDTEGIIKGLYNGTCDAGSTYLDARLDFLGQFNGLLNVVDQLEQTLQIPFVSITFSPELPAETQDLIEEVFFYIEIYNGGQILTDLFNWDGLFERGDYLYDNLRETIASSGVSLESLVEK